jgi:hypothetical protein
MSIAASYIGVKESPKGSNNVVFNTHYYGQPVKGAAYPWCMVFVWDCFRMAGMAIIFYDGKKVASCTVLMNWAKNKGQWITSGYRRGDVVIFDWERNGRMDHTGIVEAVSADGKTLTTIEGNTGSDNNSNGGAVMRRERNIKYVVGAFRPAYKEDDDVKEKIVVTVNGQKMDGYLIDGSVYIPARKGMLAYDDKANIIWADKAREVTITGERR